MKGHKTRWLVVISAAVLLSVLAAGVFLHSEIFQRFLLGRATRWATEALGAPVRVQSLRLNLALLRLDLYGVEAQGGHSLLDPPLLHVEQVAVRFKILSLLRRKWLLQEVVLPPFYYGLFIA